jgi:hypothetical protein
VAQNGGEDLAGVGVSTQLTTYELLRILIPGYYGFASLLVYLALFDPELVAPLISNGTLLGIVSAAGGVFLGFVVYAIDWPAKRAIFKERDRIAEFIVERAKSCPGGCKLALDEVQRNAHPIYWFILDTDIPPDRRQRIFYFGSVYRLYADIRAITAVMIAAILLTILGEMVVSCPCQKPALLEDLYNYASPLMATIVLALILAVLTKWNKGDRYWRDIVSGQVLWLKLHPEVVDRLVCR